MSDSGTHLAPRKRGMGEEKEKEGEGRGGGGGREKDEGAVGNPRGFNPRGGSSSGELDASNPDPERRTSDDSQQASLLSPLDPPRRPHLYYCNPRAGDLPSSGPRAQRSCSDAGVFAASRTRAAALAASARSSSVSHHCRPPQQHLPRYHQRGACSHILHCQHYYHCYQSHGCIPAYSETDSCFDSIGSMGHACSGRRAHSHSSVSRLVSDRGRGQGQVKGIPGQSTSSIMSRSGHRSSEEEVKYVWKDGRVQLQPARCGVTTPDLSSDGHQHVQYMWRNGSVQRVVRGSNHELLSAEVVPPRGEVRGVNYCIVFSLMAFFVISIVSLVFVLRTLY